MLTTLCPTCTDAFTPVHGRQYQVRARSINGLHPQTTNPTESLSGWIAFGIDLSSPSSSVISPSSGIWQAADFGVTVADSDSGSGVDRCRVQVVSSGTTTLSWAARPCNSAWTATVSPTGYCRHPGASSCVVQVRSIDVARRWSSVASRAYSIDWMQDPVLSIGAYTSSGGSQISSGQWTMDADPFFAVEFAESASPLAGHSWSIDSEPDCVPDTSSVNPLGLQLSNNYLGEGVHDFRVRTIDEAGNCGPTAGFSLGVDTEPDTITTLTAQGPQGEPISDGVWQRATEPEMSWTFAASSAPIIGFSFSTSGTPDCIVVDVVAQRVSLSVGQGITTFRVRAIDEAGNCGPVSSFDVAADSVADHVANLRAFRHAGGAFLYSGVWYDDADPYMSWNDSSSTSPILGYAVSVDAPPDCVVTTVAPEYQFPDGSLSDGMHEFNVKALDVAGNCGVASQFDLAVDSTGDPIADLRVFSHAGGPEIYAGIWQGDADPFLNWAAPDSASPILGYAVDVDTEPSCAVTTHEPEYQFPDLSLPDGMHQLYVRALDVAGNCGPAGTFAIWVSSTAGTSPGRVNGLLEIGRGTVPGELVLTWGASCSPFGTDYSVHEGEIGTWNDHSATVCTTSGQTTATIQPDPGNRYFLIAPISLTDTGSYGLDSGGVERPPSTSYCLPQVLPTGCP